MDVAVVMGTYNRLPLLQKAVASVRWAVGALSYEVIVVDGGSTDGTREWLGEQGDVVVIQQELPLVGAVKTFNQGFARAVDDGARFVEGMNDDSAFIHDTGVREIEQAVAILMADPKLGGVVFEMDTRRVGWVCEEWAGIPYGNTCLVRREVGMAVARAQGDPEGKAWWCRDHHTYASDTCFGLWLHRLGWLMHRGVGLRIHDYSHPDAMHKANFDTYVKTGTAALFHQRWGRVEQCRYSREDAERYGGVLR